MCWCRGEVRHSRSSQTFRLSADGEPFILPATGGITYNAKIGDPCCGWAADHLEPGVTTRNSDDAYNAAYSSLSCIGNVAIVRSGDAKGSARLCHRQARRLRTSPLLF